MSIQIEDIYSSLLDNSADGIIVSDTDGNIVSCNTALSKLIGKKAEQLQGEPLSTIVDVDGPEPDKNDGDASTSSGSANGAEAKAPDKVSSSNPVPKPTAITGRSGADLVMPVAHFPVTKAKSSGRAKRSAKVEGYLTIVYIQQANTVQQAQTEFVSTVSHELRTPLTSIKGFADTILRAGDRLDVSQQRRYVGIIKDQADRLTRLVEDLLAVSRLESKKLQLTIRAIDLTEAIERVERNLTEKASNHRIVTDIPPGLPPVWADADRLEQILTNLIDNAIKYSPAKTTVTVVAKTIQSDRPNCSEMVEFAVSDQGVGIAEEHLPKIFSKFSRLDNPLVRQTEGTGLGLYITRSLAIALGGEIEVASRPGCTTFTVRLPAASFEQQAAMGRDF